eukprot:COSAG04_NODE_7328_length_1146_cov_1.637058_1_plen_323_part_00
MPGPEAVADPGCSARSAGNSPKCIHGAAKALAAGTDLNCGQPWGYTSILAAIKAGLATEAQLDTIVGRSLGLRMRVGMFDATDDQPYTRIPISQLGSPEHHEVALQAAAKGLVLLRNPGQVLPLSASKKTAVVGPQIGAQKGLMGSYFDIACPGSAPNEGSGQDWSCILTPLAAIANLTAAPPVSSSSGGAIAAVKAARAAEQVIVVLGEDDEGEGHDRKSTTLDPAQVALAEAVLAVGKPTVIVLLHGGILSVDSLAKPNGKHALVNAWFPGLRGAEAMAKSLFGFKGFNRWGKLPATIYAESFCGESLCARGSRPVGPLR